MHLATTQLGRIIMFDGPDGVGKTEQIRLAEEVLKNQNRQVYVTRIHGGTPIGEKLREISLSDIPRTPYTDLFISRAIQAELTKDLHEKRAQGIICLVDRSPASMWAYQVRASGLPEEYALPLIQDSFRMFSADSILVYEASLHVLNERLLKRSDSRRDYFESKPDSFHEWVIIGYTETSKLFGTTLIDASGSIESVHQKTMEILASQLYSQQY